MSIIGTLFGWTKLPAWVQELIMILAIVLILSLVAVYVHHRIFDEGIAAAKAEYQRKVDQLDKANAQKTAELQAKADMAEKAREKEQEAEDEFRRQHPVGAVRLCIPSPKSNSGLPPASQGNTSNDGTGTSTAGVHSMPPGDSSAGTGHAGPDISTLLELLAVKGDKVSSQLREFQAR